MRAVILSISFASLLSLAVLSYLIASEEKAPSAEGEVTKGCVKCHADSPAYAEWKRSRHARSLETIRAEKDKTPCYRCHGTKMEVASDWNTAPDTSPPTDPVTCYSCHKHDSGLPHNLKLPYDQLCSSCHKRTCACLGPGLVIQAHTELFYGRGGYGVESKPSVHLSVMKKGCVDCHMNKVEKPPEGGVRKTGGHTFVSGYAVCSKCHSDAEKLIAESRAELERLLKKVEMLLESSSRKGSIAWKRAKFNYNLVRAEKSLGVHNFTYSKMLLEKAMELLLEEWGK